MKKKLISIAAALLLCIPAAAGAQEPTVNVDFKTGEISVSGEGLIPGNITVTVFNTFFTEDGGTDFESDIEKFESFSDEERSYNVDYILQTASEDGKYNVKYISTGGKGKYAALVSDSKGNYQSKYFTFVTENDYDNILSDVNWLETKEEVIGYFGNWAEAVFGVPDFTSLPDESKEIIADELLSVINGDGFNSIDEIKECFGLHSAVQSFYAANDADKAMKIVNKNRKLLNVSELDSYYSSANESYKSKICRYILNKGIKDYDGWCDAFKEAAKANVPKEEKDSGGGSGGSSKKGSISGFTASSDTVSETINATGMLYTDLPSNHWAYSSISTLTARGILSGDGEKFRPDENVTRAEFVKIVLSAMDLFDANAKCNFADVSENDWYYPYIATASTIEIASGTGNGMFNPDATITRQDAAKILNNAISFKHTILKATKEYKPFADEADIASYASYAIKTLYTTGIINGYEDGTFKPEGFITRAEAAKMMFSFLQSGI